jgi:hypothetical protein
MVWSKSIKEVDFTTSMMFVFFLNNANKGNANKSIIHTLFSL